MEKNQKSEISRRDFIKATCSVTLAMGAAGSLVSPAAAQAQIKKGQSNSGPYNILMIVTDQERHLDQSELSPGSE
jgi:hypothetical protein